MKRKFFGMLLMGAMTIASVGMFTSCKDYDDDINNLQKQIDGITAQNLQSQLTALQNALTTAQGAATAAQSTADKAVSDAAAAKQAADAAATAASAAQGTADAAATAASAAQGTADAAAAAAEAAQKAADAARAIADAAAKQETVTALEGAIEELKGIINGKIGQAELDAAIQGVEAKIAAIDEKLLTLDDVNKLLANAGFATQAAVNDLDGQIKTLNAFMESIKQLDPIVDQAWKDKVDAAIASLEGIKADIAAKADASALDAKADKSALDAKANQADLDELKGKMQKAEEAIQALNDLKIGEKLEKLAAIGANVDVLNIFVKRDLKSLVLRPSVYYGGIEGVSVYIYDLPVEKPNKDSRQYAENKKGLGCNNVDPAYRYFDRAGNLNISDYGYAEYHVNPTNVDLSNFTIDFYNHNANILEPAAWERTTPTRSGDSEWKSADGKTTINGYGIHPVYKTTEALFEAKADYLKDGILTVPFTADAQMIEDNLKKGVGTIASLSMTKKGAEGVADTTVNSDYAIVVPQYGYGLLIGDNKFENKDNVYTDEIGKDNGTAFSENLHRNFSFLALAATAPTHGIKYDESFDITAVLESRVVLEKADWLAIEKKDTASLHAVHMATAQWDGTKTANPGQDSDCSIDKDKVRNLTADEMERLGLSYDIQPVDYVLGSNKTGETVHLELITDENGHVIAYPRNVTADGKTIKGQTANAACVGRQPIVCIMVKHGDDIVSFAYMKFLITPDEPGPVIDIPVEFNIPEVWVNCKPVDGRVTWSQVENLLLDDKLGGMSKADFDKNYVFDYFEETKELDDTHGATSYKVTRKGIQYDANGKRIAKKDEFGIVAEEWNESAQHVEDATTHIIKWSFTADELKNLAQKLKDNGGLQDNGNDYVNKDAIVTYVRYAHLNYTPEGEDAANSDAPAVGAAPEKGRPSIWVKLILKAGDLHVAKGDMGANKILTFWYDLNSKTNATGTDDAFEVRVNVPVPVPEASATQKTIGYGYEDGAALDIRYDNLLEMANDAKTKRSNSTYSEFTKNLKDYFIDGKLSASVKDPAHFSSINDMKLGCEFILPMKSIGYATGFEYYKYYSQKDKKNKDAWDVWGYTKAKYTLVLNDDHTKILIAAKNGVEYPVYPELITLNYDDNATPADRQVTVLNYVNGEAQDDILNYMTHNELGERETFTAYINIKAVDACAPVYWSNMWFNVRFLRPLDLENPKQGLVPDAPNDWHSVDLTDALIVKDWREYYGDRQNRTGGKDVSIVLPSVGNQKAFDYAYYQVELDITENVYYTDANLGTNQRSDVYTLGHMPVIIDEDDAKAKGFILTSQVPNLKLEKTGKTTLRYLNNSGVTGGFHVFIPITMTYVYGFQSVRQTKWVTVGVTASVQQAMFE